MRRNGGATHSEQNLRIPARPQLGRQKAAKIQYFNRLIKIRCNIPELGGSQQQMLQAHASA